MSADEPTISLRDYVDTMLRHHDAQHAADRTAEVQQKADMTAAMRSLADQVGQLRDRLDSDRTRYVPLAQFDERRAEADRDHERFEERFLKIEQHIAEFAQALASVQSRSTTLTWVATIAVGLITVVVNVFLKYT
ncbi:MAG TPA: hypothetical protein VF054_06600 [Micromonosporaceae bacterium]